ncbi:hypothetical protein [Sphingobacterium siyangense]|uniref:hypothetical protein n=1 Tax=Sphingobacterium siyangense TaxID=459529 RepID=UPI003DA25C08
MNKILIIFILFSFLSCKKGEDPVDFKNEVKIEILSDQPIENLLIVNKDVDKVIFPKQEIELKSTYINPLGVKIFRYIEIINSSVSAKIELSIPFNADRKIFDVGFYNKKYFDKFFNENNLTKKLIVIPKDDL